MRTITISVNGDADVRVDGIPMRLGIDAGRAPDPTLEDATGLRHDTPIEVAIAATAHEANRQYCRLIGDAVPPAWKDAPGDIQATVIDGVRQIESGAVTTPEQSHARWMALKLDEGWTYAPDKSYSKKTHPNLVPFAQLAAGQRVKDRLFFAIAHALLPPV